MVLFDFQLSKKTMFHAFYYAICTIVDADKHQKATPSLKKFVFSARQNGNVIILKIRIDF